MVRFAVVGLGMGRGRSHLIQKTEGAELKCVVDLNEELAKKNGEELNGLQTWTMRLAEVTSIALW